MSVGGEELTRSGHKMQYCVPFRLFGLPHYPLHHTSLFQLHLTMVVALLFEPCHEKTCLRDFQPGKTQTSLLSYRD